VTETGYVYTLEDPRTGEPRYVGATTEPDQRFQAHLSDPHSDALAEWVAELDEDGLGPEMSLVRVADAEALSQQEREVLQMIADEFDVLNVEMSPNYSVGGSPGTDSVQDATGQPPTRPTGGVNEDFAPTDRQERCLELLKEGRGGDGSIASGRCLLVSKFRKC